MKNLFIILLLFIAGITLSAQDPAYENLWAIDTIHVKEVIITGPYSAVKETPFSFTNINKKSIDLRLGSTEPAVLLSKTPSMTYYSDNGMGSGYIYYRMRGIDQTRINSTFNGVPMNEPEDQGIYYNNYYNFLGAVDNVQVIRGAGMSKPGVSSYGGSINFNFIEFPNKFSLNSELSMGSFGTFNASGGVSTSNFFINGSYGSTQGFKYNTSNNSWSTFYGGKVKDFTLYGFIGKQRNGMGWLGEPIDSIYKDPRYNSNTPDETDDFLYIHNQVHWDKYGLKIIVYHTYLKGWYDTDIAHFDPSLNYGDLMNRIALKANWFGTVINYNLKAGDWLSTNYGVSAYTYNRDHEGYYNGDKAYYNNGARNEVSPYAKGEVKTKYLSIYGDVQYRYSIFSYDGIIPFESQKYSFLNWSAGITVRTGTYSNIYYGIGRTNREPTRTDLFMGWDDYDSTAYNPTVPETALDNELGFKYSKDGLSLNTNLYYMNFKNEIVLNGQYGPNGILLHQNVDNSFRSGVEINGSYKMFNGLEFILVGNISYNRIKENDQTFQPVLTPSVIISTDVKYNLKDWFYVGLNVRYNGDSYIDFANDHTLPSYTTLNAYTGLKFKRISLQANLNNITNELILGNAIMGYDGDPLYFVMAKTNGLVTLKYKF